MILDIHDSLRSRYVSAGHPHVRRINKRKLARFLLIRTKRNLYHRFGGSPGVAHRYLETVRDLGIEDDGKGLELYVPPSANVEAENVLTGHPSPIVGIAPSAVHANKRWRPVGFAETALNLCGVGGTAVLFGSQEDRHLCSIIEHMIVAQKPEVHVLNTAGTTALPVAAALMDHCEIVISNDTGLMHLAAARGRKVVAIFGPTVREFGFFPFGTEFRVVEHRTLDCRPCTHIGLPDCPRGHFRCMNDITADMVTGAARELLDSRQ
jgi:heptosyltransferase-2